MYIGNSVKGKHHVPPRLDFAIANLIVLVGFVAVSDERSIVLVGMAVE